MVVNSSGGGNRSSWRKPPTCRKSLTNYIRQCCIKCSSFRYRWHSHILSILFRTSWCSWYPVCKDILLTTTRVVQILNYWYSVIVLNSNNLKKSVTIPNWESNAVTITTDSTKCPPPRKKSNDVHNLTQKTQD